MKTIENPEERFEEMSREAYRISDRMRSVMRELGGLVESATEFTEWFAPEDAAGEALMRDAYDLLNGAALAQHVMEGAHDVFGTLAAY